MKKTISLVLILGLVLIASVANAEFVWGTTANLGPTINSSYHDFSPWISADGLSLYFASTRPSGSGDFDLWVATRASTDDDWPAPINLGETVNSPAKEWFPNISADGLSLYFARGLADSDIWLTIRNTRQDAWGPPVKLVPPVNSSAADAWPNISPDGCTLYFGSNRSGGYGDYDIWVVTRATTKDEWGELLNLGPTINTWDKEAGPCISADGLSLFFHTRRPDGFGASDLYMTRRNTISDKWSNLVNLGPSVNSVYYELCPSIPSSGLSLYFSDHLSNPRPNGFGGADLWHVSITPVVDFNGDGFIDTDDLLIMIDNWGTSESLCDIGPMPWGDGVVDIEDLTVFIKYWEQENMSENPEEDQ